MAVAITIRNVPDEVRNELASRAALKGWSLQEFLLHELVDLAGRPDREALIAAIQADLVGKPEVPVAAILEAIHADRR
jgi:plasmid stability protein